MAEVLKTFRIIWAAVELPPVRPVNLALCICLLVWQH